jgi:hypothetical protein
MAGLRLCQPVVAQHDLVTAAFVVADVLAPFAILAGTLVERRDL